MKYHINPVSGEPGKCTASVRACPHGGEELHFDSKEAARAGYERLMEARRPIPLAELGYGDRILIEDPKTGIFIHDRVSVGAGGHMLIRTTGTNAPSNGVANLVSEGWKITKLVKASGSAALDPAFEGPKKERETADAWNALVSAREHLKQFEAYLYYPEGSDEVLEYRALQTALGDAEARYEDARQAQVAAIYLGMEGRRSPDFQGIERVPYFFEGLQVDGHPVYRYHSGDIVETAAGYTFYNKAEKSAEPLFFESFGNAAQHAVATHENRTQQNSSTDEGVKP